MLRNRHVIIALLLAPLLAVLAWFAVGALFGEKPRSPRPGEIYPLLEQSGCRYAGGACELENADLRVGLSYSEESGGGIELTSSHALDSVLMSVARPEEDTGPRVMEAADEAGRRWRLAIGPRPHRRERIRVVLSRAGVAYVAEASTEFLQQTGPPP